MSGIHLRPARREEKAALEALQLAASLMWESDRAAILANPDACVIPEDQFAQDAVFVAERRGEIVGLGVVLRRADGEAELDGLFTHRGHWGQGVGRALVEEAERRARRWGAPFLNVTGNPNAEGFYLACGFAGFGVEATPFGKGLRLRKAL